MTYRRLSGFLRDIDSPVASCLSSTCCQILISPASLRLLHVLASACAEPLSMRVAI